MDRLDGPGVAEMTRLCAERCQPSPVWARLSEFATAAESRTSWTEAVETTDGRTLHLLVAPLPDASTLVVFRDLSAERADLGAARERLMALGATREQGAALEEMALEQLRLPVEQAVRQLMAAIPAAQTPEAFQALSTAAQSLKDGLARSGELRTLARRDPALEVETRPLAGLEAALAARGLRLAPCADAAAWPPELRRVALAFGFALADIAAPGAEIVFAAEPGGRQLTASAEVSAETGARPRAEGVGAVLARRIVEEAGGALSIENVGGRVTFAADLAAPKAGTAGGLALRA